MGIVGLPNRILHILFSVRSHSGDKASLTGTYPCLGRHWWGFLGNYVSAKEPYTQHGGVECGLGDELFCQLLLPPTIRFLHALVQASD